MSGIIPYIRNMIESCLNDWNEMKYYEILYSYCILIIVIIIFKHALPTSLFQILDCHFSVIIGVSQFEECLFEHFRGLSLEINIYH